MSRWSLEARKSMPKVSRAIWAACLSWVASPVGAGGETGALTRAGWSPPGANRGLWGNASPAEAWTTDAISPPQKKITTTTDAKCPRRARERLQGPRQGKRPRT